MFLPPSKYFLLKEETVRDNINKKDMFHITTSSDDQVYSLTEFGTIILSFVFRDDELTGYFLSNKRDGQPGVPVSREPIL